MSFSSILITGASSGIGRALAEHYAAPGLHLALTGRDQTRLEKVAAACRSKGAVVTTEVLDVVDQDAMAKWIETVERAHPIDLAIANAGISAGTGSGGESDEQARRIFATNLDGVLNTLQPLIPHMIARGKGQLAVVSSLAAFRGFPGAPAYSGSKAAVKVWAEGLRGELLPHGIGVSVICPGFVKSPMTDVNDFPMPGLMQADKAARVIAHGLARNKARIAFPLRLYWAVWLLGALPPGLTDRWLAKLPKKSG